MLESNAIKSILNKKINDSKDDDKIATKRTTTKIMRMTIMKTMRMMINLIVMDK